MKKRIPSVLLSIMIILSSLPFAAAATGCEAEYPFVINGTRFDSRPQRVVCTSRMLTDVIVEIGLYDNLVGRPFDCEITQIRSIPAVGKSDAPSVSQIVEINPDLVIIDNNTPQETVDEMVELGLNLLFLYVPYDRLGFKNVYACIGAAMGGRSAGQKKGLDTVEGILTRLDDIQRLCEKEETVNVCIFKTFTESGAATYVTGDEITSMGIMFAGGRNVAIQGRVGRFDLQKTKDGDPDVILCPEGKMVSVRSKRILVNSSASITNRIYEYDLSKFDTMGSGLITATWELAHLFHPTIITKEMLPEGAASYITEGRSIYTLEEYRQMVEEERARQEAEEDTPTADDFEGE